MLLRRQSGRLTQLWTWHGSPSQIQGSLPGEIAILGRHVHQACSSRHLDSHVRNGRCKLLINLRLAIGQASNFCWILHGTPSQLHGSLPR